MSGFSADWLALREPADAAARSSALTQAVAESFGARATLRVLDLGGGTGSNIRFLAGRLHYAQHWLLIDHDPGLLAEAPARIAAWAAARAYRATSAAGELIIGGDDWRCQVATRQLDLRDGVDRLEIYEDRQLVTASALLDLVSERWMHLLAARCRDSGATVLAALNYDGRIESHPADDEDALVRELVNRHQRTDKGFGAAAGPEAAAIAEACFTRVGYRVQRAPSDWVLEPDTPALQIPLIDGWAEAATAIAPTYAPAIASWRIRRLAHVSAGISRLTVGHEDLAAWSV